MHNIENDRKCAPRKMIENSHPEKDKRENAQMENDRKITHWKKIELAHLENERMENARHGK